ncbi:MAG: nuclear transport factor 2 family protein [Bacteroidia bacterium]|nr:nuclear transport factor 2 family protein [Bacteroidia bacterium]
MTIQELVTAWFELWTTGNFEELPLAENFTHTSPYGIVNGRENYMNLARTNKEAFTGNTFDIHETLFDGNRGCIRYTMKSPTGTLEVSEWIHESNGMISKIIAYYNLQEERAAGRGIQIDN